MAEKETGARKGASSRTVKDKWRAKVWYKVQAPGLFQHALLGETAANEPGQLIGRTLETTLEEVSGGMDVAKSHVKLRFQITQVAADQIAQTRFIGHELTSDYVRRLARRKRSKIDLSIEVATRDAVAMVLKPVAVGEQRLQTRLRAELRHKLRSVLVEEAAQRSAVEFVREILNGELTKILAHGVKSLYPLKKIEIRRSDVLGTIAEELPSTETGEVGAPIPPPESPIAADAESPAA
ncbi:MAG: 30S ribosomal protein S3ae [Thermoplasmata archaeon]